MSSYMENVVCCCACDLCRVYHPWTVVAAFAAYIVTSTWTFSVLYISMDKKVLQVFRASVTDHGSVFLQ